MSMGLRRWPFWFILSCTIDEGVTKNVSGEVAQPKTRRHGLVGMRRKRALVLLGLMLLLVLSVLVATMIGSVGPIGWGEPFKVSLSDGLDALLGDPSNPVVHSIIWDVRIPRVLMAGLVGASLACAGTAMQAIFRNSMADPFIIGVSSGAAVGAAAASLLGLGVALGVIAAPVFAFVGAVATVFLVYSMGVVKGRIHVDTLLLSGVAVAAFLGATVSTMMYFARQNLDRLLPWLLGTLKSATWDSVLVIAAPIAACCIVVFLYGRDLNAILLGEETAHNLGADPEFLKKLMLTVAALMTAAAVAFVGIVGFVGLIVPHMTRLMVGADHRILVPAATLLGAVFLIWANSIAIAALPSENLPVGVVTALCGGPFFLYLLRRSRTRSEIT